MATMTKVKAYHHPDLRQALLDGAMMLVKEEGLRNVSLRRLAAKLGVSHAAPYRHFENKEQLLVTLMAEGHRRLRSLLLGALERCKGNAAAKHLALGRAYLRFARQYPDYLQVMFARESVAAASARHARGELHPQEDSDSFGVLTDHIRQCQAEGFLPAQADVGALSLLAWAEVHGLAILCSEGMIAKMAELGGRREGRTLDLIFALMKARLEGRSG
jgi:AcrR family transcriptional regulator